MGRKASQVHGIQKVTSSTLVSSTKRNTVQDGKTKPVLFKYGLSFYPFPASFPPLEFYVGSLFGGDKSLSNGIAAALRWSSKTCA
jgi:hypothetical protein